MLDFKRRRTTRVEEGWDAKLAYRNFGYCLTYLRILSKAKTIFKVVDEMVGKIGSLFKNAFRRSGPRKEEKYSLLGDSDDAY